MAFGVGGMLGSFLFGCINSRSKKKKGELSEKEARAPPRFVNLHHSRLSHCGHIPAVVNNRSRTAYFFVHDILLPCLELRCSLQ